MLWIFTTVHEFSVVGKSLTPTCWQRSVPFSWRNGVLHTCRVHGEAVFYSQWPSAFHMAITVQVHSRGISHTEPPHCGSYSIFVTINEPHPASPVFSFRSHLCFSPFPSFINQHCVFRLCVQIWFWFWLFNLSSQYQRELVILSFCVSFISPNTMSSSSKYEMAVFHSPL